MVLIAPTAFKGTLDAGAAARALAQGVKAAWPAASCHLLPLSDGGDGFLSVLVRGRRGRISWVESEDALGGPHLAPLGWLEEGRVAVAELARVVGLASLRAPGPHSAATSGTDGLGRLLAAALAGGPDQLLVGLGGSASTDGGAGLARPLGYRLLDREGEELPRGGAALRRLERIVRPRAAPWARVEVVGACDVAAPLLGSRGSARSFGPQKGADPATVAALEEGLGRLAEVVARDLGVRAAAVPGAGAAGGAGFGLLAFAQARLISGSRLVAERVGLDGWLARSQLVVTGEGRVDRQSLAGKAVGEVVRRARGAGIPCLVVAGSAEPIAAREVRQLGAVLHLAGDPGGAPARRLHEAARLACQALSAGDPAPGPSVHR